MPFTVTYPTRHTDTFAGTGYVHAGVLLSLTELAYAAFEAHCGVTKPLHLLAVQTETRAVYHAPLRWQEGAAITVTTREADAHSFTQEFEVRSAETSHLAARFEHHWVWLDTTSGHTVPIPEDAQQRLRDG